LTPKTAETSSGIWKFKVVPRTSIPSTTRARTQELAKVLNGLGDDDALSGTEKELGITFQSIKGLIKRLKDTGDVTDDYDLTVRTKDGQRSVYIVRVKKESK
jgi:hypothetical protein